MITSIFNLTKSRCCGFKTSFHSLQCCLQTSLQSVMPKVVGLIWVFIYKSFTGLIWSRLKSPKINLEKKNPSDLKWLISFWIKSHIQEAVWFCRCRSKSLWRLLFRRKFEVEFWICWSSFSGPLASQSSGPKQYTFTYCSPTDTDARLLGHLLFAVGIFISFLFFLNIS